jgi:maltooligosyltrehalose trehalohydrolase
MNREPLIQGADLSPEGVTYRVWAPACRQIEAEIQGHDGHANRLLPLDPQSDGYFRGLDSAGRAGDLYRYRLDGTRSRPDPASRWQPQGVHGPSMVIDPAAYEWRDHGFRRCAVRDLVIYEIHIGGFTAEGTFRSAISALPHLRTLGVTALELMPLAEFPGGRNWGYDGVSLFAPSRAYGHPDDLRALIDAAHGEGLTVILDVVYNHFGPEGNYLGEYLGAYLDESRKTPWGGAVRYESPEFRPLRALIVANVEYWMREFHIDGFRLDATHAIIDTSPRHLLAELNAAIHARGGFSIAEDSRNDSRVLLCEEQGGAGFDGVWADDFHHVVRVAHTHENESYLGDFRGSPTELAETLRHGWFYRGQFSPKKGANRGTECRHLPPERFVHCISNHDQIGNRALGDRFSHAVVREAYLASSALLCLTPYTPLLFMGQEWAASTPFLFFTDHPPGLGKMVTEGRREEFQAFAAFRDPAVREKIPDPQKIETFLASKLDWRELGAKNHAQTLELYRACLALRHSEAAFRPHSRDAVCVEETHAGLALRLRDEAGDWLLLFDLTGGCSGSLKADSIFQTRSGGRWEMILSTSEARFGGNGRSGVDLAEMRAHFTVPELVLLHERPLG